MFDSTVVEVETDSRRHRLRRGLPARAVLPAGLRRRRPRRHRRAGAASARRGPAAAREAEPPHGRRAQGPSLRQVRHRHGLLGHPRQGRRASRSACCWAAATATISSCIAPSRRNRPRRWPARGRLSCRRLLAGSSSRSAAIADTDIERIRAVRGDAPAGRSPGRRRQHRLADARRHARRPRGARRGRLHRAALPELRGMPDGPPPLRSSVRARRGDRLDRRAACAAMPIGRWTW